MVRYCADEGIQVTENSSATIENCEVHISGDDGIGVYENETIKREVLSIFGIPPFLFSFQIVCEGISIFILSKFQIQDKISVENWDSKNCRLCKLIVIEPKLHFYLNSLSN